MDKGLHEQKEVAQIISKKGLAPIPGAGLAQLGERQTEVHFIILSEGHVFDPHKPQ